MSEKRCYTGKELQEILGVSRPTILLVAEAIWSRYMPSRKIVDRLLAEGVIGEPTSILSNFGFPLTHVNRM